MTNKTKPDATLSLGSLVELAARPLSERLAAGNGGRHEAMANALLMPMQGDTLTMVHITGDRVTVAGEDRQPMRIGRFLTAMYAGLAPGMTTAVLTGSGIGYDPTNASIPEWAVRVVTEVLRDTARSYLSDGAQDGAYRTILFDTADDIERVYRYGEGFASCMEGNDAVRCYGYAEDVALAVLYKTEDLRGVDESDIADDVCPAARVIVHTGRKKWSRTYGPEPATSILRDSLRRMEYEYDIDPLRGVELPTWDKGYGFAAPYLDGVTQTAELCFANDGEPYWYICSDGEYELTSQGGVVSLEERESCDRCGDRCHTDEMVSVHWVADGQLEQSGDRYCDSCRRDLATWATNPGTGEELYVLDDDVVRVDDTDYAKTDALWDIAIEYKGSMYLLEQGAEDEADGQWTPYEELALLDADTRRYTHIDNVVWSFPLGEELAAEFGDPLARAIVEKCALRDNHYGLEKIFRTVDSMADDEEAVLAWAAKIRQLLGRIEASGGDCGDWGWMRRMHATDALHQLHELVFGKPTDAPMGRYRQSTPRYLGGYSSLAIVEVMADTIMRNAGYDTSLSWDLEPRTRTQLWEYHRRWEEAVAREGYERGATLGWAEIEPSALHEMTENGFDEDVLRTHKMDVYYQYEYLFHMYECLHGRAHPQAHRLAELRDILAEEGVHIPDSLTVLESA